MQKIFLIQVKNSQEKLACLQELALLCIEEKKTLGIVCGENQKALDFVQDYLWEFPKSGFLPSIAWNEGSSDIEPLLISKKNSTEFKTVLFLNPTENFLFTENESVYQLIPKEDWEESKKRLLEPYLKKEGLQTFFLFYQKNFLKNSE